MAHAMERLLATPKTIPVFPASDDMVLFGWDLAVIYDPIQRASDIIRMNMPPRGIKFLFGMRDAMHKGARPKTKPIEL